MYILDGCRHEISHHFIVVMLNTLTYFLCITYGHTYELYRKMKTQKKSCVYFSLPP